MNANCPAPPVRAAGFLPCRVVHHRLRPKEYRFGYSLFLLHLDLDFLAQQMAPIPWFSLNRFNLFSFVESDYLDGAKSALKPRLLAQLAQLGWELPAETRVTLLTLPRMLGYVFHPVSFYYLSDEQGSALGAAVEVGNTFGEHKLYPLPRGLADEVRHRRRVVKDFYVSPFSPLDLQFDFRVGRVGEPGSALAIDIHEHDAQGPVFLSHLAGRCEELRPWRLLAAFFTYPLLTLRIITAIHRHALVLWLKRLRVTGKRVGQENQTGILRHHPGTFGDTTPPLSTASLPPSPPASPPP